MIGDVQVPSGPTAKPAGLESAVPSNTVAGDDDRRLRSGDKCAGRARIRNLNNVGHALVGNEQVAVGVECQSFRTR